MFFTMVFDSDFFWAEQAFAGMQENIIGNLDSAAHTPFSHVGPRGEFKKLNAVLDAPKAHHNTPPTAHHLKPKFGP